MKITLEVMAEHVDLGCSTNTGTYITATLKGVDPLAVIDAVMSAKMTQRDKYILMQRLVAPLATMDPPDDPPFFDDTPKGKTK